MADLKINKLLDKRTKLLSSFFFRTSAVSVLVLTGVLLLAFMAIAFATCQLNLTLHLIFGGLCILVFVIILLICLKAFKRTINAEELEAIMKYDRDEAYSNVFKQLDIENIKSRYHADPYEVVCPEAYPGKRSIAYCYSKKNRKVYYSQVGYSWLFLGERSLYHYHVSVNHLYGYIGHEKSTEFNYEDVVGIHTETTQVNGVEKLSLRITLINGESFVYDVRAIPNRKVDSTHKLSEKESEMINTIRNIIRAAR